MSLLKRTIEEQKAIALAAASRDALRQADRRPVAVGFKIAAATIDNHQPPLSDEAGIYCNRYGDIVAGGWFLEPSEIEEGYELLMSYGEFRERAMLHDGYYEFIIRGNLSPFWAEDAISVA